MQVQNMRLVNFVHSQLWVVPQICCCGMVDDLGSRNFSTSSPETLMNQMLLERTVKLAVQICERQYLGPSCPAPPMLQTIWEFENFTSFRDYDQYHVAIMLRYHLGALSLAARICLHFCPPASVFIQMAAMLEAFEFENLVARLFIWMCPTKQS